MGVRGKRISIGSRPWVRWSRRNGAVLRLAVCFLAVASATFVIEVFEKWRPEGGMFWVANGLLLAYLLLAPRRRWPAYLTVGFLALSVRLLLLPGRWGEFLLYNLLDILEVMVAALLLRPRSKLLPRFTERAYLVRLVGYAGLAAPALAAGIFALANHMMKLSLHPHPFLNWMGSDSLGMVIGTPAFVAVFQTRFRKPVNWGQNWLYPTVLVVVSLAAFMQNSVPLVYLIYPLLVLVARRLGLGYASLFMLIVAIIAGWFTIRGSGPFWTAGMMNPLLSSLMLQISVASAVAMIYCVSVVLENQKKIEQRLQEIVALHTLINDTSRDAILLSDFSGRRSYVSAAALVLTGWTREELATMGSIDLIHPEDRAHVEAVVHSLRTGADGAMMEYRIRKQTGDYVWAEASLRVVRDRVTGAPAEILNIVRDITDRKHAQEQLQEAYKALEEMAVTDALTGLANRRQFDLCLSNEWRRGMRERKPLSMLLIDADLFKSYNDCYGHVRGDSCLKQIAEAAMDVVWRPGDLVARFGGEEFAVILPNTANEGAMQIARQVCEALGRRKLIHSANPAGIVTVSVGCATVVPSLGQHSVTLIELADQSLYKAKRNGRNRACSCNSPGGSLSELAAEPIGRQA
jgi:diguanylate cyclase (GGDEF)-like protein/PAS domain S-box-containing protein